MTTPQYRPIVKNDLPHIETILDGINLFPSDMLEDTIAGYLENETSSESWICATIDDVVVGFGYCVQEKFTEGTYNIYALGVQQELQGQGIGSVLLAYIEASLAQQGARILIIETSSSEDYELTRKFYEKNGYICEASITDFWGEGDDKVVYWKRIV